jgi:hypothetical protein
MYGGDLSGGAVGGSSWKAPEDPTVVVGGGKGEDVSINYLNFLLWSS